MKIAFLSLAVSLVFLVDYSEDNYRKKENAYILNQYKKACKNANGMFIYLPKVALKNGGDASIFKCYFKKEQNFEALNFEEICKKNDWYFYYFDFTDTNLLSCAEKIGEEYAFNEDD